MDIDTMKHSSVLLIKGNRGSCDKWIELDYILLSEMTQADRDKYRMISLTYKSLKS